MKRFLFLLLMLVSSYQFVNSQIQIALVDIIDNNGVMFNQHTDKHFSWWIDQNSSYAVVPIEGLTQKDIYQKLLLALNDCYMNINQVVTKVEYEAITINAYHNSNRGIFLWNNQYVILDGFKYRLSFKIKDGKLRLDTPSIIMCDYHYTTKKGKVESYSAGIDFFPKSSIDFAKEMDNIYRKILLLFSKNIKKDDW